MKRGLLLIVSLLAVASVAFAQAGSIGVFSDVSGASCDLSDSSPGLLNVYIVHVYSPGATASQFRINWDAGMNMTLLSEAVTSPYIKIGTCAGAASTVGCAIAYGSCVASPNMILTVQFFAQANSANDVFFHVLPDGSTTPPKTSVLVTDCNDPPVLLNTTGGEAILNNTGPPCNVPVEETSWGQIKSLYR